MTERPVVLPKLAKYLVELRGLKGWKQSQAANIARRRRLPVTYTALRWLEDGKNHNPEPDLLRGLAALYDTTYEDLAQRFIQERYEVRPNGSVLVCHSDDQRLTSSSGGADVPVAAQRIAGLEGELQEVKARLGAVQDAARALASAIDSGGAAVPHKRDRSDNPGHSPSTPGSAGTDSPIPAGEIAAAITFIGRRVEEQRALLRNINRRLGVVERGISARSQAAKARRRTS